MKSLKFNQQFDELTPNLHSFAYKLTNNKSDASDLFQETAFKAMKNKNMYKAGTNLKAWLFTIMKNIFINDYRKKKRANTVIDTTDERYFINSGKVAVVNKANSNIMVRELKEMIRQLDDSIKVPFMMYFSGYKYQEIADYLELPLGTVKSRIFFARRELKQLVNDRYDGLEVMRMAS